MYVWRNIETRSCNHCCSREEIIITLARMDQDGTISVLIHPSKLSANLYDLYHCCVYSKITPDDGKRNCLKYVEFYSKNKFEKLVHLLGFIIRMYHDARSPERQIPFLCRNFPLNSVQDTQKYTFLYIYLFIYLFIVPKSLQTTAYKDKYRPLFTCVYKWVNVSDWCAFLIDTFHLTNIQKCFNILLTLHLDIFIY